MTPEATFPILHYFRFPILHYFRFDHLPPHLQEVSAPISRLAFEMAEKLPKNAETSAGLRKLLEAKDCFVRAALVSTLARPS